jgi:hypothetical protein
MRIAFISLILSLIAVPPAVRAGEGSWAFEPKPDKFTDDALLDLRSLNEKESGATGFIRLSKDGNDFVRGDGKPIRFWGAGSEVFHMSPADMDTHCRFLAKLGVNLVRLHASICDHKEGSAVTDVDEKEIDGIFRFVKSAKANGIYLLLSPYYASFNTPRSWGLDGYEDGKRKPLGALFVDPKLQAGYRAWTKALYARVNPHTGKALKDDPTVAILQVQNEDSLLFWTFSAMPKAQLAKLSERFGPWLTKRYGSVAKAYAAWEKAKAAGDDIEKGVAAMLSAWHLTQDFKGGMGKRVRDQVEFMGTVQRQFYADMGKYLRTELGCKQLLNATNWRTANDAKLKEVERWTYAALDVDAENEYYGSDYQHLGEFNGFRVDAGHKIVNESCLTKPLELPVNFRQQQGHPFVVTETAWKHPNLYQSEGPFLAAAYQSLSGLDAVIWFSALHPTWNLEPLMTWWTVRGSHPWHKWSASTPMTMGMFPANALVYRMGYVKPGETVLHEERPLGDLWDRKPPQVDDNEIYGVGGTMADELSNPKRPDGRMSRAAFLVGRVESVSGGKASKTKAADLSKYLNGAEKTILASNGQLKWDWGKGLCTVDAPSAQGVAGFLKAAGGTFALGNVTIESENDYATVQVVAMDGKPIATSKKLLVQVGTTERLTGFATQPTEFEFQKRKVKGEEITSTGKPPRLVANTKVTLVVKNAGVSKATLLDAGGYAVAEIPMERTGGSVRVQLPPNAMYVVIR